MCCLVTVSQQRTLLSAGPNWKACWVSQSFSHRTSKKERQMTKPHRSLERKVPATEHFEKGRQMTKPHAHSKIFVHSPQTLYLYSSLTFLSSFNPFFGPIYSSKQTFVIQKYVYFLWLCKIEILSYLPQLSVPSPLIFAHFVLHFFVASFDICILLYNMACPLTTI
jgi:hypothetical protein